MTSVVEIWNAKSIFAEVFVLRRTSREIANHIMRMAWKTVEAFVAICIVFYFFSAENFLLKVLDRRRAITADAGKKRNECKLCEWKQNIGSTLIN